MFGNFGFVVTLSKLKISNLMRTRVLNCAGQKASSGARTPRGKCQNGLNPSVNFFIFSFNSTHTYGTHTLVKQLAVQHTKTQQMTAEKKM